MQSKESNNLEKPKGKFLKFLWNHREWFLAVLASIPGWIALSLTCTDPSCEIAEKALSARPEIRMSIIPFGSFGFSYDTLNIEFKNVGLVDAIGLEFHVWKIKFFDSLPTGRIKTASGDCLFSFGRIAPFSTDTARIDAGCFAYCDVKSDTIHCAIELRWQYHQERDNAIYDGREFFLFNSDGELTYSFDSSVQDSLSQRIYMQLTQSDWEMYDPNFSDTHERVTGPKDH